MNFKAIILILISLIILTTSPIKADDCADKSIEEKVRCYELKIQQAQNQQKTLTSTIDYLNNRLALSMAEIAKTEQELKVLEEEIAALTIKINRLDQNLAEVSKIMVSRIGAAYKRSLFNPMTMIFANNGLTDFLEKNKYLKAVQENDKNILLELQSSKDQHQQQKELKISKQNQAEELKKKLAAQNEALNNQRKSKQQLLEITKNDEKNYQNLLATARAEMAAIQSIIAGGGQETLVGEIGQGTKIASVISGRSACSTGTHLHFEVSENKRNINPAGLLKPIDVTWDLCGWWGECDYPFSFTGSWDWPINGKPIITQGYGVTGYSKTGAYNGGPHTGIDMVPMVPNEDLTVKAVKAGKLYKGTIGCGGGILRYVKVEHKDSNIATYYLHVNY